jgi:hypothetical protein
VVDVGEGAEFALEAEERLGIQVRHRLERDDLAAFDVSRLMNDPHSPFAEATLDDEATGAVKSVDRSEHRTHVTPTIGRGTTGQDTKVCPNSRLN